MHVGNGVVWAFGAIALISLTSLAVIGEEICPERLGGGEVKEGKYQFQFKSWGWPKDSRYVFCNCVRNDSKKVPLYIDWKGTNLSGFAAPGQDIHVYDTYSSDEHDEKKSPLYYGLGLKKINALTMFPKEAQLSGTSQNTRFAQLAEPPKSDALTADNTVLKETRSEGKIFIPVAAPGSKVTLGDKRDIVRQVENRKLSLVPVYMVFQSRAVKVGDKIELFFMCRYEIPRNFPVMLMLRPFETVAMISADPKLKVVFGDSLPLPMSSEWSSSGRRRPEALGEVEVPSDSTIVLRRGFMTFAGLGDVVLGSIPVNYVSPD